MSFVADVLIVTVPAASGLLTTALPIAIIGDMFVAAEGGAVRLSGTVRSPHERQVAGLTAWAAHGATSVENDIRVN